MFAEWLTEALTEDYVSTINSVSFPPAHQCKQLFCSSEFRNFLCRFFFRKENRQLDFFWLQLGWRGGDKRSVIRDLEVEEGTKDAMESENSNDI